MAKVSGVVEAVSTKFGKFGINVGGKWYNTNPDWIDVQPNKGDEVEFDDGGRNYIKGIKIVGASSGTPAPSTPARSAPASSGGRTFPVAPTAPERTINRQNALTNAVAYVGHVFNELDGSVKISPEKVIDIARMFEAYTTGDLDMEEAKAALAEMGA